MTLDCKLNWICHLSNQTYVKQHEQWFLNGDTSNVLEHRRGTSKLGAVSCVELEKDRNLGKFDMGNRESLIFRPTLCMKNKIYLKDVVLKNQKGGNQKVRMHVILQATHSCPYNSRTLSRLYMSDVWRSSAPHILPYE